MDNQHRKIAGYRELNEGEIDLMNEIKALGPTIADVLNKLATTDSVDQRWLAIGRTELQQGLMALTRAVAKPTFF
jgi:hypothetical protein